MPQIRLCPVIRPNRKCTHVGFHCRLFCWGLFSLSSVETNFHNWRTLQLTEAFGENKNRKYLSKFIGVRLFRSCCFTAQNIASEPIVSAGRRIYDKCWPIVACLRISYILSCILRHTLSSLNVILYQLLVSLGKTNFHIRFFHEVKQ